MHGYLHHQQQVENALIEMGHVSVLPTLQAPIGYFLKLGGKRLRPVLTLMGCEMFEGKAALALQPALGIELFHNFTLLHDDIMDQAPLRRYMPTVHTKWNTSTAILAGDAMFVKAVELVSASPIAARQAVMAQFLESAMKVCEGQQMDMDFETRKDVRVEEYINMIALKTAELIGCSLCTGAMIAGCSEADARSLFSFGVNLGIAFQLQDDLLDVYGNPEKFGKQSGGDILADKKTYLLLTAFQNAGAKEQVALNDMIGNTEVTPELKVKKVTQIFDELMVKDRAQEATQKYYSEAMGLLNGLNCNDKARAEMHKLADLLLNREH